MGRSAVLLGVALGGFFDGILLHQILQWHHLLSDVEAAAVRDLRVQLLADGIFHLLMYVVAALALWQLWRHRIALQRGAAAAVLAGGVTLGFGLWHVLDAILSHWITGIHRVKSDAAEPLLWDLAWFAVFGVLPMLLGLWLRRKSPPPGGPGARRAAAGLAALAVVAGALSAFGPPAGGPSVVVFGPGTSAASAFNALAHADARVLWADRTGGVWVVQRSANEAPLALWRAGALLVGGSWTGWGCANWTMR
jgi:uncharacterized membrane protein